MTVTRCESMFQSRQRFARFRKLRIDRKRALVPSACFRFQAGAFASTPNVERRIGINIEDVRFESIRTDRSRRWRMTPTEQSLVLSEQCIQRDIVRFWHDHNQQSLLVRPIVRVEAMIVSSRAGDSNRAFLIGGHESFQIILFRIVTIERDDQVRMLFAQLTHVPFAEQKWHYHESRFVADVLNFLKVHQRKGGAVPADQQNRMWPDRVEHVFAEMTGDKISALIDSSLIC